LIGNKDFVFDPNRLSARLKEPLPGELAQIEMAHAFRRKLWPAPQTARKAGVMIHFYPLQSSWHMVLIERSSKHSKDRHAGQISFPGGGIDQCDFDIIACAFRETKEEIGVDLDRDRFLGLLTPLYIPVSNYLVHPVISWSPEPLVFIPNTGEVEEVLQVPVSHFFDEANIRHMDMIPGSGMYMKDVPYYDVSGKAIWGATAMIISELVHIIKDLKNV
jgi:8-oxo-dGTP pyrophosphatase MutT (NUDIX family)